MSVPRRLITPRHIRQSLPANANVVTREEAEAWLKGARVPDGELVSIAGKGSMKMPMTSSKPSAGPTRFSQLCRTPAVRNPRFCFTSATISHKEAQSHFKY